MIPISDPKQQFISIQDDILSEMRNVLLSGQYILGPKVTALEEKVANRLGVTETIAVGNGTDALVLTLHAYGIGEGDEVLTTPFTFFATAEAITRIGATPIFVDIDERTFNIDSTKLEEKITTATKAIMPVHLFGQPANMKEINDIAKRHRLVVIEDACQAFGATYQGKEVGSLGDASCFSFFPTKNLSTMGDGGMVATSDSHLAKRIRKLRAHGSYKKYYHDEIGYNSRLDEMHAAVLLTCLNHIDNWNKKRQTLATRYDEALQHLSTVKTPQRVNGTHVFHLYCIEVDNRHDVMEHLKQQNIQSGVYYPRCIHLQKAYKHLGYRPGDFPMAERLSNRLLAIPLYPELSFDDQNHIIKTLKGMVNNS